MNKRFWQGFMAVMLGITLLMGSWSFQPAQMAIAEGEGDAVSYKYEDGNGGSMSTSDSTVHGPDTFGFTAPEGQTFSHWSGNGQTYKSGDTLPDTSMTLTAKWKDKEVDPQPENTSVEGEGTETAASTTTTASTQKVKKAIYVGYGDGETVIIEGAKAAEFAQTGFMTIPEGQEFDYWYGDDNKVYKPGDTLGDNAMTLVSHWKTVGSQSNAPVQDASSSNGGNDGETGNNDGETGNNDGETGDNDRNTNDNNGETGDISGETGDNNEQAGGDNDQTGVSAPITYAYHEVNYRVAEDSAKYSSAIVLSFGEVGLPIPSNMEFVGWKDSEGNSYGVGTTFGDSAPSTLIAQLKEKAPAVEGGETEEETGFRVEYINNGVVKTHTSDSVLSLEAAGFDADDSFIGWQDSQGNDYVVGGIFGDMVPAALHAQFAKPTTEGDAAASNEPEQPKTVTITFHAGEGSVEKTLTVGQDGIPSLFDLGLSLPEGNAFWFWGTGASVTTEAYNGSQYYAMDSVKENTPSDLYAIYAPMLEEADVLNDEYAIAPLSLEAPAAFTAVHYYVNSNMDAATMKTSTNTANAQSPGMLGMTVNGHTFNHWVVDGGTTTVGSNDTIARLAPNDPTQTILVLYGDWTPTTGATVDISQTVDKEAAGRGETVYFSATIRNTSTTSTWVRMESVVEGDVTIGRPVGNSGSAAISGNKVTWDVSVANGSSTTLQIPVTVKADAANSAVKNTATIVKMADSMSDLNDANKGTVCTSPSTSHTVDALTVRYNGNGGFTSSNDSSYVSSNYKTAESNLFRKSGSSFLLWNTMQDGSGISYAPGRELPLSLFYTTKTVDLYAQWTVPTYEVKVTTAQGAIKVDDIIRYTIEVSNKNAIGSSEVYVRDVLPTCLTYVSASPSPLGTGNLQWRVTVPANGTATITVNAKLGQSSGSFTNDVSITQINGVAADATAFPNSTLAGNVTTTIGTRFVRFNANGGVVLNTGETYYQLDATGITPTVPDLSNTILRTGFALTGWSDASNKVYKVGETVIMPSTGDLVLNAVWEASSVLTLTNTPSTNYAIHGDTIIYTIVVNNTGAAPATNVTVANALDANMANNTDPVTYSLSTGTYNTSTRQWVIGTLAANSSATLRLTYRVKSAATNGITMALTSSITPMGASATARVSLDVYGIGLRVSKRVTGNRASTTKDFTFTLSLRDYNGNRIYGTAAYTTSSGITGSFQMDQTLTFTLRHDEHITFTNLPSGTRYTVEEINHSGYWPQQSKFTGTLYDSAYVEFVNSRRRNTNIPQTGYGDGSEELLWLMLPLLAGAAWLVINRRRKLMQGK